MLDEGAPAARPGSSEEKDAAVPAAARGGGGGTPPAAGRRGTEEKRQLTWSGRNPGCTQPDMDIRPGRYVLREGKLPAARPMRCGRTTGAANRADPTYLRIWCTQGSASCRDSHEAAGGLPWKR